MRSVNGLYQTAIVVIAGLLAAVAGGQEKGATEMERLAGKWECVAGANDGKPLGENTIKQLRLTLTKEGGYKTELGEQVLFDSTCKLDTAKQPPQIDMIGTEGANKGKTAQGIYRLEGDRLTICYTMPGHERPTQFESQPGSGATLVTWRRAR
jgi:uncharacterized protein (TIGR03067 family)